MPPESPHPTRATLDVFLIRHGVTDWNENGRVLGRSAIALNARGRAQAKALGAALHDVQLDTVLVSPQLRAQQTAELSAQAQGLPLFTEPRLDEVWVGRWQGKTWAELRGDPDLEQYGRDPTYECEAIEPAAGVQQRVVAVVEQLRAGATHRVALVSHGDPLKLVLAHYLDMDLTAYRRLAIDTGSVSVLRFGPPYGSRLLVLNWKPPGTLRELVAPTV